MLKAKVNWGLDFWQQRAMAELEDEMVALASVQAEVGINHHALMQKLFALDRAQAIELRQLRGMVEVLTEMLVQSGALDGEDFGYRMEAELDRQRAEAQETRADGQMVRCVDCNRLVAIPRTHLGAFGTVCDACHYAAGS